MSSQATIAPTAKAERINSMDVIRGVALCGILLMNIIGFGLAHAYFDPTVSGGSTGWNLKVWWITSMFFEGTMRGMFSMLFGAGILLFLSRATDKVDEATVIDLYFRRIMWLFLFGVIHAYILLWDGEILYPYSIMGMFVFAFRKWTPKYLIIAAIVLLSSSTALAVKEYFQVRSESEHGIAAKLKKEKKMTLSKEEIKAIEKWDAVVTEQKPSQEVIDEQIEAYHQNYFSILMYRASVTQFMQTYLMYRVFFWDIFAMMLMGMALLKTGVLKAAKSYRFYWTLLVIGYGIGLTVNFFETQYVMDHDFGIVPQALTYISYNLGRVTMTLGHIALIMIFVKSQILSLLQRSLGAVGQMAFTNYIMQTLICNTIFLGFGFSLFGKLQRYELYFVVFGVWIFELIVSPIWLKHFRFGPLEWAWRSLTYWKKQPFVKETISEKQFAEAK